MTRCRRGADQSDVDVRHPRWPWQLVVLLNTAAAIITQPSYGDGLQSVTTARLQLDRQFNAAIDKLSSEGLSDDQLRTRRATRISRDPSRQYFYVPPEMRLFSATAGTDPATDKDLERIQRIYADQLFQLVQRAINERRGALAYQWSFEILRHRPDHSDARKIVGLPAKPARASLTVRPGRSRHPKFGWAAGTHRQVDTRHFRITTDDSEEAAKALAEVLETLHATWRQMFFELWSNPSVLRTRMNGRLSVDRRRAKHQVILFRDRETYVSYLQQLEPQAQLTLGYYHAPSRAAFFYGSAADHQSTWQHEVTHQLFQEILGARVEVGQSQNFWVLEGIALYMESLGPLRGYVSVGGLEADRLQIARYRALRDEFYEPLEHLSSMGRRTLQQDPRIRQLYSQAAGLTHFLMDFEQGRYRRALHLYLRAVYENRADENTLARVTKTKFDELDSQYLAFLELADEDLKELDREVAAKSLSMGHTRVGNEGLLAVPRLESLTWLDLKRTKISDVGTQRLVDATRLRQLNLEETEIGDVTVARLTQANQIEQLDLSNTRITDDALTTIGKMKQLKSLWLTGTDITDVGLKNLHGLPHLETLDVSGTKVTPEGWQAAREALPQLE